jgi:hypothetical protein
MYKINDKESIQVWVCTTFSFIARYRLMCCTAVTTQTKMLTNHTETIRTSYQTRKFPILQCDFEHSMDHTKSYKTNKEILICCGLCRGYEYMV